MKPTIISFAGKLHRGKSTALNLLRKHIDADYIKFAGRLYEIQDKIYEMTGLTLHGVKDRELLIFIGMWGRDKDPDLWLKLFQRDAQRSIELGRLVLNDDCRFNNEARAIHEMGGIVVRIDGPLHNPNEDSKVGANDISEAGISDDLVDIVINNTGTIEDLEKQIKALLF